MTGHAHDKRTPGCVRCDLAGGEAAASGHRILWNDRRSNDIDEIVVRDCTVHVEELNDTTFYLGIEKDGVVWTGEFSWDAKAKRIVFSQDFDGGIPFDRDECHEGTNR